MLRSGGASTPCARSSTQLVCPCTTRTRAVLLTTPGIQTSRWSRTSSFDELFLWPLIEYTHEQVNQATQDLGPKLGNAQEMQGCAVDTWIAEMPFLGHANVWRSLSGIDRPTDTKYIFNLGEKLMECSEKLIQLGFTFITILATKEAHRIYTHGSSPHHIVAGTPA